MNIRLLLPGLGRMAVSIFILHSLSILAGAAYYLRGPSMQNDPGRAAVEGATGGVGFVRKVAERRSGKAKTGEERSESRSTLRVVNEHSEPVFNAA
ncbi:hypothetical protein PUR31_11880 [Pseudomonas mosselii]|uniref:hypothetical protein n=1 Tax=unclassified Pseudomonas TaxID=196821 RepID=UPI001942C8B4|nr:MULTISPECIES: hypothetical protein [unclassified Pseudomonas]MCP8631932.1 hypothetical protein [Pseudomonas sp. DVZ6]MDD7784788.1 hypothetical protein [Pseudomonas sp. DVZ24]